MSATLRLTQAVDAAAAGAACQATADGATTSGWPAPHDARQLCSASDKSDMHETFEQDLIAFQQRVSAVPLTRLNRAQKSDGNVVARLQSPQLAKNQQTLSTDEHLLRQEALNVTEFFSPLVAVPAPVRLGPLACVIAPRAEASTTPPAAASQKILSHPLSERPMPRKASVRARGSSIVSHTNSCSQVPATTHSQSCVGPPQNSPHNPRRTSRGAGFHSFGSAGTASECASMTHLAGSSINYSSGANSDTMELYAPQSSLSFMGNEDDMGPSVSQLNTARSPRPWHQAVPNVPTHVGVPLVLQAKSRPLFGRRAAAVDITAPADGSQLRAQPLRAREPCISLEQACALSPIPRPVAGAAAELEPTLEYTKDTEEGSPAQLGLGPVPSITSSQSDLRPSATFTPVPCVRHIASMPGTNPGLPVQLLQPAEGLPRPASPPLPSVQQIIQQEQCRDLRQASDMSGIVIARSSSGCSILFPQHGSSQRSRTVSLERATRRSVVAEPV